MQPNAIQSSSSSVIKLTEFMLSFFLISNMYPTLESPGYGIFVKNMVAALKAYAFEEKYSALIEGKPHGKWNKLSKYLVFYRDIVRGYFGRYDFIYVHFPNQAIPVLNLLMKLHKRPVFINYHGEDLMYPESGLWCKLGKMTERFCTRYANAIVVPSEYFKRIVIERNIIPENRVIVSASGGINPEIFQPKERFDHRFRIGFVGRLEEDKGVWEYVRAFERISRSIDVYGTIIGYGNCYEDLKAYIYSHCIEEKINLINGISQDKLAEYYSSFDLFVFNSNRAAESLGLTGIEAMACSVPVVGSNVGGIATYVRNGVNGYLVRPKSHTEIADAIIQYYHSSAEVKETMKREALLTAKKYYSDVVACQLSRDLQKLINI